MNNIDNELSEEWDGTYTMDIDKELAILEIVRRETDSKATLAQVEAFLCYDWAEGYEHQEWLDSASPEDIAEWIHSGWH